MFLSIGTLKIISRKLSTYILGRKRIYHESHGLVERLGINELRRVKKPWDSISILHFTSTISQHLRSDHLSRDSQLETTRARITSS